MQSTGPPCSGFKTISLKGPFPLMNLDIEFFDENAELKVNYDYFLFF